MKRYVACSLCVVLLLAIGAAIFPSFGLLEMAGRRAAFDGEDRLGMKASVVFGNVEVTP